MKKTKDLIIRDLRKKVRLLKKQISDRTIKTNEIHKHPSFRGVPK